ncbi:hypothetical protein, partial [Burkholderia thailandensis]|uniref:hypothetical protein n=2 Tax=Burkholderia thailandensis TaxID=57975 RepID=UPI001ED98199
ARRAAKARVRRPFRRMRRDDPPPVPKPNRRPAIEHRSNPARAGPTRITATAAHARARGARTRDAARQATDPLRHAPSYAWRTGGARRKTAEDRCGRSSADSTRTTPASTDDRTGHARKTVGARGSLCLVGERSVLDGRRAHGDGPHTRRTAHSGGDGPSPRRIGNGISDYFRESEVQFAFRLPQIVSDIGIKAAPRARIHPEQGGNPR